MVHFHAVIRLDDPDGSSQPPPPYATVAVLTEAARADAKRVRVTVKSDAVGERELGWGEQFDVREIASFGTDAEFTDQAVAAYVAKYATNSRSYSTTLGALRAALRTWPTEQARAHADLPDLDWTKHARRRSLGLPRLGL
ncbi:MULTISPECIES: replication initiator [Streptomyces]|uniref:replication initiator n=1 Tax=Streptomyces TaxID=1883 RepID=UPI0033B6B716